jgi:hypothetical protein
MTELDRKQEALASVRRLIRTGNNKSFWRRREVGILAEISRLSLAGER